MHRRHQVLWGLFREENSRRRGGSGNIKRHDRFKRSSLAIGDHRPSARLDFQRDNPEILLSGKNQRLTSRVKFGDLFVVHPPEKFNVVFRSTLQESPQWPVTGNL